MAFASDHASRPPAPFRQRVVRWMRGPTFARDIAIVLVVKFALLMALKYAFFNHPQAQDMSMPPAEVARALLSVPAHPQQTTTTTQGNAHAH